MSKNIHPNLPSLLFIFLYLSIPSFLFAGTITVSSNADTGAGSFREAVTLALAGDSINFLIRGEIVLDSQVVVNKNLSIIGPGADLLAITTVDSTRLLLINRGDTVFVDGLRFYNGNATKYRPPSGGAISNLGILYVSNSIFHDNIATTGGAIENQGFGASSNFLSVNNCSFYHNLAIQPIPGFIEFGGALYADGRGAGMSEIEVFNSTFAENQAKISGGAIYAVRDPGGTARISLSNCTVAFNTVEGRCGGVDVSQSNALILKNSIIAENTGRDDRPDVFGALVSGGNNLVGDTGMVVLVNALPTDFFEADAKLGPFGLNGGIFPSVSLACGSPAIDGGDDGTAPLLDMRGQNRVGASDIGAYERNEKLDLQISNLHDTGWGSLRQALQLSCPGDTLRLDKISGIISLASTLNIQQDQVLEGNPQNRVFLSGADSLRIFYIEPGISLTINALNFEKGNPKNFGGGAIMNKGSLFISNSSFRLNKAQGAGAIANYGDLGPAILEISNSSFGENEALFLDGGVIDNRPFSHSASTSITHSSFALNRAGNFGGAVFNAPGGQLLITNSLFGGNDALKGPQLYGTISTSGTNLVQDTADIQWLSPISASNLIVEDPLLAPLGFYGGPSLSFRLLPGSPAIDAGDNSFATPFDQRGQTRIFNGTVDIGAYEFDPATSIYQIVEQGLPYLYPHPNRGRFTVNWQEAAGQEVEYVLYSLAGKQIQSGSIQLDHSGEFPWKQATIAPGFYVIRLRFDKLRRSIRLQISQ